METLSKISLAHEVYGIVSSLLAAILFRGQGVLYLVTRRLPWRKIDSSRNQSRMDQRLL